MLSRGHYFCQGALCPAQRPEPSAQNMYNFAVRYDVAVPLARDIVLLSALGVVPSILLVALTLAP